ncbi:MAG: hypothetical protein R3F59_14660 [Myxococcota bacterium]
MRPAYRYSLVVAVGLLLVALAAWGLWPSGPPAPQVLPPARRVAPDQLRPRLGKPPAEAVPGALDRIEAREEQELGPGRAAGRRGLREELIRARGGEVPEAPPEAPAP